MDLSTPIKEPGAAWHPLRRGKTGPQSRWRWIPLLSGSNSRSRLTVCREDRSPRTKGSTRCFVIAAVCCLGERRGPFHPHCAERLCARVLCRLAGRASLTDCQPPMGRFARPALPMALTPPSSLGFDQLQSARGRRERQRERE